MQSLSQAARKRICTGKRWDFLNLSKSHDRKISLPKSLFMKRQYSLYSEVNLLEELLTKNEVHSTHCSKTSFLIKEIIKKSADFSPKIS